MAGGWKSRLRPNRIYIIPTRLGALFLGAAVVMVLIGAGYSNNLVNLLAFFLLSLIFVAMVQTHLTIRGAEVEDIEIEPAFAGGELVAHALLRNTARTPLYGIRVAIPSLPAVPETPVSPPLRTEGATRLRFLHPAGARGRHEAGRLQLSTIFPLGLFYAWKLIPIDRTYVVYPEARGSLPLPRPEARGGAFEESPGKSSGGDDFRGHRAFMAGDSPRHVDWKAYARGRPLLVKELNEGDSPGLALDWDALPGLGVEDRLSQLSAWIREARRRDLSFRLKLPGREFGAASNSARARECLEALALYPEGR